MRRILLFAVLLFSFCGAVDARRTPGDSGGGRDSIRAAKEAADSIDFMRAVEALDKKAFVLKIDRRIYEPRSKTWGCDPQTNFILLDGDNAIVQFRGQRPENNDTFKCKASEYEMTVKKRGDRFVKMKLKKGSVVIILSITLMKDGNYCNARLSGRSYYPRFTVTGSLYPLEDSDVYVGIDWRG